MNTQATNPLETGDVQGRSAPPPLLGILPACNGANCGCTDGLNHSPECRAEHDALCNESAMLDHINHGGWKCDFCGYNGQDNQQGNFFCARCARHR